MSEKFDIFSKIFFRDVGNFVQYLCVLVLRHQMRVSNYFVNSFYSVWSKSFTVFSYLRNQTYHENLIYWIIWQRWWIFNNLYYSIPSFHRDFVKPSFPESSIFPCTWTAALPSNKTVIGLLLYFQNLSYFLVLEWQRLLAESNIHFLREFSRIFQSFLTLESQRLLAEKNIQFLLVLFRIFHISLHLNGSPTWRKITLIFFLNFSRIFHSSLYLNGSASYSGKTLIFFLSFFNIFTISLHLNGSAS